MKSRSLMTAICVLAAANIVSAAPFAYVANSGTRNVSVIDTVDNQIKATVALPDSLPTVHPYAYGITVGASGQNIYVGLQDTNEIYIFDAVTKLQVKRISLGSDVPGGLAVNAAETRLYVASNMSNTLLVIDITGSAAAELKRVQLDTASVSNPEGVVINSLGDKAYVANKSTGTIAEISLDEANNVYTRISLTTLGTKPVGLAIAGNKLYASDVDGNVKIVNTDTKAITAVTAGGGVSVAVNPVGGKVYVPSSSLDKVFVIDGTADTLLGNYAVSDGPFGSSVTPDGTKLYLTGLFGTGNKVQVFNTATNVVDASITLPVGAKPTSLGNFIGPVFDRTITATDDNSTCAISPEGAIAVNDKGRSFSINTISGNCEVWVDGVSVGQPATYLFSPVATGSHTINAIQAAAPGTYYLLNASWISSVGGYLVSTPAGINATNTSASFLGGTGKTVTIAAASGFKATNWTGDCAGTPDGGICKFDNLAANKNFGATVVLGGGSGPIFNATKSSYYQTLAEVMAAASTDDQIKISSTYVDGGTTAGPASLVRLSSGWDAAFTTPSSSTMGPLVISTTGVVVDPSAGYTLTL